MPFATIVVLALLIYYFPLSGMAIHSDVHWIFRLQVADASLSDLVPPGLKQFAGIPSGFWEGCGAYYQAFGRANCLDVVTFRWLAAFGGGDNDRWLLAYVLLNSAAMTVLFVVLRRLGVGILLTSILVFGAMLAPTEPWMTPRISEPKAALLFLLAVSVTLSPAHGRHWFAAGLAAASAMIKEPMVFGWLLVVGLAIGREIDEAKAGWAGKVGRTIVLPHLAGALAVVAAYGLVIAQFDKRNDYVFFIAESIPPVEFVATYWASLQPLWAKGGAWALLAAFVALLLLAKFASLRSERSPRVYSRGELLMLATALLAIAGHGLVYYTTNRHVSDGRYVVPANYYLLLLTALALPPVFCRTTPRQQWCVAAIVLVFLLATSGMKHRLNADQWTLCLVGLALLLPVLAYRIASGRSKWVSLAMTAAWAALLPVAASRVDAIYHEAGTARADQRSWQGFVDTIAGLPDRARVQLQFTDPYMIETAWGLQTELLLRNRPDLDLRLAVSDTREYLNRNSLLQAANESFNFGRQPLREGAPQVKVSANRGGNRSTVLPAPGTLRDLVARFVRSPATYFHERYVAGKAGYLDFKLEAL